MWLVLLELELVLALALMLVLVLVLALALVLMLELVLVLVLELALELVPEGWPATTAGDRHRLRWWWAMAWMRRSRRCLAVAWLAGQKAQV